MDGIFQETVNEFSDINTTTMTMKLWIRPQLTLESLIRKFLTALVPAFCACELRLDAESLPSQPLQNEDMHLIMLRGYFETQN